MVIFRLLRIIETFMQTKLSIFLLYVLFFFYKGSAQECLSYEFYNKTERLGIGLLKIEKQLIVIKNQQLNKDIEEDMYSPKHIVPLFFSLIIISFMWSVLRGRRYIIRCFRQRVIYILYPKQKPNSCLGQNL